MSQWVVFTREPATPDIDQVWIFENEEMASAWVAAQLKLNRRATMVKAPVVKLPDGQKNGKVGEGK